MLPGQKRRRLAPSQHTHPTTAPLYPKKTWKWCAPGKRSWGGDVLFPLNAIHPTEKNWGNNGRWFGEWGFSRGQGIFYVVCNLLFCLRSRVPLYHKHCFSTSLCFQVSSQEAKQENRRADAKYPRKSLASTLKVSNA